MRVRRSLSLFALLAVAGFAAASVPAAAETGVHAPFGPDAGRGREVTEEEAAPPEGEPVTAPTPAPMATPTPPRPQKDDSPEPKEYVVSRGDTLGGIAHRYGVSSLALSAANGFTAATPIRIGQKLSIPAPGETVRTLSRVHVVVDGNTLRSIAKSYGVSIEKLREVNHLRPSDSLQIGQRLIISGDIPLPASAAARPADDDNRRAPPETGVQTLAIPGSAPAYYFEPTGPGRNAMRPVIIYLHGRGAEPRHFCQRWARVARNLGWLVCPSGPEDRGDGKRGWGNNWPGGRNVVMSAIDGLRKKYGRRVQLYGNTLIGFSEGAFVAMNVGLREPHTFNRWLILGADTDYWGAAGLATLPEARGRVRRVYLITGRHDDVVSDADEVKRWLVRAGVPVRVSTPKDMGHEVALEAKPAMYQAALRWLGEG
jgi:LysM repeat protein/predicted esterase